MTREEQLIRLRREARGQKKDKKSLALNFGIQFLISVIIFGGVMSVSHIDRIKDNIDYYINYSVDFSGTAKAIISECKRGIEAVRSE
ncbi:MAG: hypothetical protein PHE51_04685 [Eubacteriales bacterium]|nr:hypothetical protein [Eubacteriales bacterium]